jgi:hypothetical protein
VWCRKECKRDTFKKYDGIETWLGDAIDGSVYRWERDEMGSAGREDN